MNNDFFPELQKQCIQFSVISRINPPPLLLEGMKSNLSVEVAGDVFSVEQKRADEELVSLLYHPKMR